MNSKWKKVLTAAVAMALSLTMFSGCGGSVSKAPSDSQTPSENLSDLPAEPNASDNVVMNIASLKGPTGLGMLKLMANSDASSAKKKYAFQIVGQPDEIVSKLSTKELDIAAVPTNLAATLYNKTNGEVKMLAVNTLGVLYLVQKGEKIASIQDLKGKIILASGKGTTAQYVLEYLLKKNGLTPGTDVTIEYKAEHAETVAALAASEKAVAVLPQPFATSATMKNSDITVALDLTAEWGKISDNKLTMGASVVRKEFLEAH
ncbi:MAG: MqnA/MqnD/SBP family protein, partial [Oscillospiraceae bacterium]